MNHFKSTLKDLELETLVCRCFYIHGFTQSNYGMKFVLILGRTLLKRFFLTATGLILDESKVK